MQLKDQSQSNVINLEKMEFLFFTCLLAKTLHFLHGDNRQHARAYQVITYVLHSPKIEL